MKPFQGRGKSRQRGATAVVVAVSLMLFMAVGALGVDVAKLVGKRQEVQNALDAAATAGAQMLPDNPARAQLDAKAFAALNSPGVVPTTELRCVVAFLTRTGAPDWATAQTQCNITSHSYDPANCNEVICALPCTVTDRCNTMVVRAVEDVDFDFGPIIGYPTGTTGTMVAAACRGTCGTSTPNPMNVVLMADRTASMEYPDIPTMQDGIRSMLPTMTRSQQYLAFGAIHKSVTVDGCVTGVPGKTVPAHPKAFTNAGGGTKNLAGDWVATDFSNEYTTGDVTEGTAAVNPADPVVQAINCMQDYGQDKKNGSYQYPNDAPNGLGTHLAGAIKGAARKLLGSNNVASLDLSGSRENLGTPKNVIILETDGRPEELWDSASSALSLNNDTDIGSTNGQTACNNFLNIASQAKAAGILIITIGYGNANTFTCNKSGAPGSPVREVLAAAASPDAAGNASVAETKCQGTQVDDENSDGDFYFCAADGEDLASVFTTALGAVNGHGKLMALPGINPTS